MSETGHGTRAWRFYVSDMIECCEKVRAYTTGLDRDAFVADEPPLIIPRLGPGQPAIPVGVNGPIAAGETTLAR